MKVNHSKKSSFYFIGLYWKIIQDWKLIHRVKKLLRLNGSMIISAWEKVFVKYLYSSEQSNTYIKLSCTLRERSLGLKYRILLYLSLLKRKFDKVI